MSASFIFDGDQRTGEKTMISQKKEKKKKRQLKKKKKDSRGNKEVRMVM